jgi:hypothetical protein
MVEKLNQYKDMSFIWAEMSFMSRWWDRSDLLLINFNYNYFLLTPY